MAARQEKMSDIAAPVFGWARAAVRVGVAAAIIGALGGTNVQLSAQQVPAAEIEGREVIMITGSTDGLGRSVALALAGDGAHIIVHGRNAQRGAEVVEEIRAAGGTARFYQADLASLPQVRELAAAVLRDYPRLDVLINNAGIGRGQPNAPREVSADGYELRMAVNYLSHFYLTRTLIPLLQRSTPSRVVSVSSSAQATGQIDFSNIMLEREPYEGGFAYGQSKLMQIFMTLDLQEEFGATGVSFNAVHPGGLLDTSMVRERGGSATMSPDAGAEFVVNAVTSSEVGVYFNGGNSAPAHAQAYDLAARRQLRELSFELAEME